MKKILVLIVLCLDRSLWAQKFAWLAMSPKDRPA